MVRVAPVNGKTRFPRLGRRPLSWRRSRPKGNHRLSRWSATALEFGMPGVTLIDGHSEKSDRQTSVALLTRLASSARLFRSADGRFCAQVPVGDRLEIYGLRSAGFRDWLIDGYMTDQPEPPSSWAIRRVVGMLEARARFTTGIPEVFVRVGQDGDGDGDSAYFLDLGDPSGRAVAIRDQGWSVVDRPGVHFRRPEGLLPLPLPARDGSIDLLRPYVNLTEPDFRLMIAWLTAALRPVGPYPILVLNGEQASGKSTLARILRLLIDPQACPVLALPSSTENLMATAVNGWLLVYENISTIPDWLSDCVCQLAFGGGFASRTLFTNDERSVIYAQRPVILVGIDDFVVRGDLRDRSVFLHLPAIPATSRRTERTFWPAFRADYPRILGGVLDAIVGGLRELPSVDLKELPRMADYAEWGEATGRGLGWGAEHVPVNLQRQPQGSDRGAARRLAGGDRRARSRPQGSQLVGHAPGALSSDRESRRQRRSGHAGPKRSARSAANCAGSLPSFGCMDFPSTSSGEAATGSSPSSPKAPPRARRQPARERHEIKAVVGIALVIRAPSRNSMSGKGVRRRLFCGSLCAD